MDQLVPRVPPLIVSGTKLIYGSIRGMFGKAPTFSNRAQSLLVRHLPITDIIQGIFGYLNRNDFINLTSTCKRLSSMRHGLFDSRTWSRLPRPEEFIAHTISDKGILVPSRAPNLKSLTLDIDALPSFSEEELAKFTANHPYLSQIIELTIRGRSGLGRIINEIPDWFCSAIPKVEKLELDLCVLRSLPADLASLGKLTELTIKLPWVAELPDWFCSAIPNVAKLELKLRNLKQLPTNLVQLEKLRELTIDSECMTQLPKGFCSAIPKVAKLELGLWTLHSLPTNLAELQKLTELTIRSIEIHELPNWFWSACPNMRRVKIHSSVVPRPAPSYF